VRACVRARAGGNLLLVLIKFRVNDVVLEETPAKT